MPETFEAPAPPATNTFWVIINFIQEEIIPWQEKKLDDPDCAGEERYKRVLLVNSMKDFVAYLGKLHEAWRRQLPSISRTFTAAVPPRPDFFELLRDIVRDTAKEALVVLKYLERLHESYQTHLRIQRGAIGAP